MTEKDSGNAENDSENIPSDPAPGGDAPAEAPEDLGTYGEMFRDYLAGQKWIGAAEAPLVFHLRRLCLQLDASADAPAAVSSAYLQAFSRLDRRRPGGSPGGALEDPGQTSIYDHMEE